MNGGMLPVCSCHGSAFSDPEMLRRHHREVLAAAADGIGGLYDRLLADRVLAAEVRQGQESREAAIRGLLDGDVVATVGASSDDYVEAARRIQAVALHRREFSFWRLYDPVTYVAAFVAAVAFVCYLIFI